MGLKVAVVLIKIFISTNYLLVHFIITYLMRNSRSCQSHLCLIKQTRFFFLALVQTFSTTYYVRIERTNTLVSAFEQTHLKLY